MAGEDNAIDYDDIITELQNIQPIKTQIMYQKT